MGERLCWALAPGPKACHQACRHLAAAAAPRRVFRLLQGEGTQQNQRLALPHSRCRGVVWSPENWSLVVTLPLHSSELHRLGNLLLCRKRLSCSRCRLELFFPEACYCVVVGLLPPWGRSLSRELYFRRPPVVATSSSSPEEELRLLRALRRNEKRRWELASFGGCLRPSWRPTSVRACRVHLPQVNPRPGHDQQYWKPTKSPASSDYSSPWPSPSLSTVNQTNSRQGEPIWLVRFNLDKSSMIYFSDFLASDLCDSISRCFYAFQCRSL